MSNLESIIKEPWDGIKKWLQAAQKSNLENYNAAILSTSFNDKVSSRTVLVKDFNPKLGLVFYTNLISRKGQQIQNNPNASLLFFWDNLKRQIKIEGKCKIFSAEKTNQYFKKRVKSSRIGAWASKQSQILKNRKDFLDRYNYYEKKFQKEENIPLPPKWRGITLIPSEIEFWQAEEFRLHQRLRFILKGNLWTSQLLYP